MTLITRSVTNTSSLASVTLEVPGFDASKPAVIIAPSATLDLFTVLTDDELEAMQPYLAKLVADGLLTVAATTDTASFNPLGTVPSLTANRSIISNGSGVLAPSATTSTEIGYVSGVTSAIQTQLNSKRAISDGGVISVVSTDPVSPTEGQVWYNTTSHLLKYFDGTTVQTVAHV
jgi:hypothetical protein